MYRTVWADPILSKTTRWLFCHCAFCSYPHTSPSSLRYLLFDRQATMPIMKFVALLTMVTATALMRHAMPPKRVYSGEATKPMSDGALTPSSIVVADTDDKMRQDLSLSLIICVLQMYLCSYTVCSIYRESMSVRTLGEWWSRLSDRI